MHQAQPKEGHKIWLTQEADAKSWSSLKHVQPKEGRKELAPREIKFRYRRLDTTIRERAGSSQVPREAQESQRYPGLLLFVFFLRFSGREELAAREIKYRYRRLDTTIRERAGSSQVPREAQESERYPGATILCFFFLFIRNLRCDC